MAEGVRAIAALDDPVGEELERRTLESGLDLRKVRVPLGVVAVIYEARPNVTVDCAALCLKSGNAIVLRGSSYAAALQCRAGGAGARGGGRGRAAARARSSCSAGDRSELEQLATAEGLVDLVIPRGGEGLKEALKAVATVPVMYAAAGNCHVYVHADADLEMARRIAFNAKVDRPGVCNAAETLLVARRRRRRVPARRARRPRTAPASSWSATGARRPPRARPPVGEATDADWDTEYLGMKMAVGVVDSLGRGDRARQPRTAPATRRRSSPARRRPRPSSPRGSTRRSSTSTRRRGSPTASSSAWAPRSATRRRSFTPAGRSGCAS